MNRTFLLISLHQTDVPYINLKQENWKETQEDIHICILHNTA